MQAVRILLLVMAVVVLIPLSGAAKEDYPAKPIQFIVQFPAGGSSDVYARIVASKLEPVLGPKVIVVNKAGGGGTTATAWVSQQKPDGYTVVAANPGPFTARTIVEKVPYSYKDFDFIAQISLFEELLVVRSESPWKTIEVFIDDARKNPGKYTYSTSGAGSMGHLLMENVKYAFKIDVTHVPFKGAAPAMTALLGGHVDLCAAESIFEPHVDAGTLRKIFTANPQEYKSDPRVKNFKDLGKDVSVDGWVGLAGPKGMPREALKKLEAACKTICADEGFKEELRKITSIAAFESSEVFTKKVYDSYALAKATLDRLGLSVK